MTQLIKTQVAVDRRFHDSRKWLQAATAEARSIGAAMPTVVLVGQIAAMSRIVSVSAGSAPGSAT